MIFGVFTKSNVNSYIRIYNDFSLKRFDTGVKVETVAINENSKILDVYRVVGSKDCEIVVIDDNGKIKARLDIVKTQKLLSSANLYSTLKNEIK